jgi:mono/diheme cytochrome c family protein
MREVVSYLWAGQFFEDSGNPGAGAKVFASKHCASCHEGSGSAPKLAGNTYTGAAMVSALWHHGPRMLDQMKAKGIAWPRFDGDDMANLIAYLNSAANSKK